MKLFFAGVYSTIGYVCLIGSLYHLVIGQTRPALLLGLCVLVAAVMALDTWKKD
jgi:hypothetical protein